MRLLSFFMMIGVVFMSGCTSKNQNENPFYREYSDKYGAPPFEQIKVEHFMPALLDGIAQQQKEIEAIVNNADEPTFENTVITLEYSGVLLTKVRNVFSNLHGTNSNDELDAFVKEANPLLSEHEDNIYLNGKLFARIEALNNVKESLNLTVEQGRLLDEYYKRFVRRGVNLDEEKQARLREINKELSDLSFSFNQNVSKTLDSYMTIVEDESELSGLPENVRHAAAEEAKSAGHEGKWVFTTKKPSFIPVLQYGENRELRKKLLLAYTNRNNNDNEFDNKKIIEQIVNLRIERSQLLGYNTHAEYTLDNTMAKTPEIVNDFLQSLWIPSLAKAKKEVTELQKMMNKDFKGEKLEPWDWWYYTEKVRKEKYDLDEEELRPYFSMENVRKGAFDLSNRLWGLNFKKIDNIPTYHPDAEAFEVTDADGSLIGVLYTDYFPRKGKRGGAWMSSYRKQYKKDGTDFRPIIINVGNFTPPFGDLPGLLSMDEVQTLFHELGHGLHGLLSQCTYPLLSGTSVPRDFVELPSQIMENWCFEPEVLKMYAFHYETGEVISDELIEKINASSTFNQGFIMTEFMASALIDMAFHNLSVAKDIDVAEFEKSVLKKEGMIPEIFARHRSTHFAHIFSGGYSSGYYSYKWAEVLDADAFQAFIEAGDIFDKETAMSFRKNVLEKGGTDDPMILYKRFRGNEPKPDALLEKRGLVGK